MKRRTDHDASFKDPSAKVFFLEDEPGFVFRELAQSYLPHYTHFKSSGLAAELLKKKYLIDFEELSGESIVLKAKKISFISFPYEWTFTQWKEAAMLTMKIQHLSLKHGMILKDATPFNIVFDGSTPTFIDLSSFEIYKEGEPWVAFKQFSENLYLPLLLNKYYDSVANDLYLNNISGISLSKGLPMLPWQAHLNFNTFFYLTVPQKIRKKILENKTASTQQPKRFSGKKMQQFTEQLFSNISKIQQSKKLSRWNDYYETGILDEKYLGEKEQVITAWYGNGYHDKTFLDTGCNTGHFSRLLLTKVKSIIAFDEDSRSVDELYRYTRQQKINNISCFTAKLQSPTPATGWNNSEHRSLIQRIDVDVALALALVHHVAITSYIRFEKIAAFFAAICKEICIEFIPVEDPKVQLLLAGRNETFSWYNLENFKHAFHKEFVVIKQHQFSNMRILFHFKKKEYA